MGKKKVAFGTLGCKVNQYESLALRQLFKENGYEVVDFNTPADVYVINTCTVTHIGDRKSRQLIRRAKRINPDALVVVTGCYAQTSPEEVAKIPGVAVIVGARGRKEIPQLVQQALQNGCLVNGVIDVGGATTFEELPVPLKQERVRGYVKIQEGCNQYCSYCIVPYARGPLRSRRPEKILAEARRLVQNGYKELVLTGIHVTAYGKDKPETVTLASLVREINQLPGLYRLRLSSLEPQDVDTELIDIIASSPKVCRHLHLPLQSGDDLILKRMNRGYDTAYYRSLVNTIRNKITDVAITTDVMVGFPGETDREFTNTVNFCREMAFAGMHVFRYSPRRGTAAAAMDNQVPAQEKEQRSGVLLNLDRQLRRQFLSRFVGKKMVILVEQQRPEDNKLYEGLTDNYVKVVFPGCPELRGKLVTVVGEKVAGDYLTGKIV